MAADQRDLTTLADVKSYVAPGVVGNTDDATIQRLVTEVSDSCAQYCSVTFLAQEYIENRNGVGQQTMRLKQATPLMPITSLVTVTIDTYSVPLSPNPLAGGFVTDGVFVYLRIGNGWTGIAPSIFTRGFQNVQFVYWGGYKTAGQVALATTFPAGIVPPAQPFNLEQIAIEATVLALRRRTRIGDNGLSLQGQHATYTVAELPQSAKEALGRYVNHGVINSGS